MTSVQWLDEKLQDIMYIQYGYVNGVRKVVIPLEDYMKFKQEALELEKEQITDAYYDGSQDAPIKNGQSYQYYNDKFKKD